MYKFIDPAIFNRFTQSCEKILKTKRLNYFSAGEVVNEKKIKSNFGEILKGIKRIKYKKEKK